MELYDRFKYDYDEEILFIDFSNLTINSQEQVKEIKKIMDEIMKPLNHKVYSIVNYDNCTIDKKVRAEYAKMIKENQKKYSLGTVRYSNQTITRTSLILTAVKEHMVSNVCSSKDEAIKKVQRLKGA